MPHISFIKIVKIDSPVLSEADIAQFRQSNVTGQAMPVTVDQGQVLLDIAQSVRSLGNRLTANQTVSNKKATFDGSNADAYLKWMLDMDDIHLTLNQDDNQTLWAASQLLKGPALDFFRDTRKTHPTWALFKTAMDARYDHLNPVARSKQKIRNALQHTNESVTDFAERIRTLAKPAFKDRSNEKEVAETLVNAFLNGLRDRRLQEKIGRKMPKTLEEAHRLAIEEQRVREHLTFFKDNSSAAPEPMDCSAVTKDNLEARLDKVTETLADVCQILTAQTQQPPPPQHHQNRPNQQYQGPPQRPSQFQVHPQVNQRYHQRPPGRPPGMPQQQFQGRQGYHPPRHPQPGRPLHGSNSNPPQDYRWTADNKPVCHYCGNIGHVQRACRKRAAATGAPTPQPPRPTPQSGN